MDNRLYLNKVREIRDVVNYLSRQRGHRPAWIRAFIERNYFISDHYRVVRKCDDLKVETDFASIVYKAVFNNEYQDL
ncbi:MAG: hypothetical protein ACFB2Y_16805 [Fulvivirga sp.]